MGPPDSEINATYREYFSVTDEPAAIADLFPRNAGDQPRIFGTSSSEQHPGDGTLDCRSWDAVDTSAGDHMCVQ